MSDSGRILVVDDEPDIRDVCRRTLTAMGFSVSSAPDGQAALRQLEAQDFDFVLTDLAMPEPVDGQKLAETVKQKTPATDVVIMTAYPTLETAVPLLKNGIYDYLTKPFSPDLLQSVVSRCFQKRRLSEELSREKRQCQELSAAYAELQKVEHLKESILSRLSHELRTPVCSSLLALEALQAVASYPDALKHCSVMRASLSRLQKSVEQLLLMAKCSQASLALRRDPTDLKALLESVVQHYEFLWKDKGLVVGVDLNELQKDWPVDAEHLKTVFQNLLLNAIQFNKKNGSITIRGRQNAERLEISFSDTGQGIPKDKLPEIFDGFYQAAEYLTREVGGLGLGLAIVRRIVEAHGGDVRVESREGHGSAFILTLPALQKEPEGGR